MEDPKSDVRRVLNKFTLTFSHNLAELKAIIPEGGIFRDSYEIVKHDDKFTFIGM